MFIFKKHWIIGKVVKWILIFSYWNWRNFEFSPFVCSANCLCFRQRFYSQIQGLGKERPFSSLLFDVYLHYFERNFFDIYKLPYWFRYVDDTFLVLLSNTDFFSVIGILLLFTALELIYLILKKSHVIFFLTWNNCPEFLATYGVNLQSGYLMCIVLFSRAARNWFSQFFLHYYLFIYDMELVEIWCISCLLEIILKASNFITKITQNDDLVQ